MKFAGYTLSKKAEKVAPDWMHTTNNLSVKALNDIEQHRSCDISDEYNARWLFVRGDKLCLHEGYFDGEVYWY